MFTSDNFAKIVKKDDFIAFKLHNNVFFATFAKSCETNYYETI